MHLELTTFRGEGGGGGGLEGGGEKIHAGLRAISLSQVSPNGEGRTIRAPPQEMNGSVRKEAEPGWTRPG